MNIYFNFLSSTPLLIGQCPFYITCDSGGNVSPDTFSTLWEEHDLWFGLNAFLFSSSGAVISLMGTHVSKHSQLEHVSRFSQKDASLYLPWSRWAGAWGRHGESPNNADKSSAAQLSDAQRRRRQGLNCWPRCSEIVYPPHHPGLTNSTNDKVNLFLAYSIFRLVSVACNPRILTTHVGLYR